MKYKFEVTIEGKLDLMEPWTIDDIEDAIKKYSNDYRKIKVTVAQIHE